ncbi:MAG: hypothetical protein R2720_08340 [Candidatus Nanopelagicales bacterium]
MTTLHIEHAITDFATWRAAFDRFEQARRSGGVTSVRIAQPVDDPHYLVVDLDFERREQAEAFLAFLRDKVWATPADAPALVGSPRTLILEPARAIDKT